jgi:hypothetical protein
MQKLLKYLSSSRISLFALILVVLTLNACGGGSNHQHYSSSSIDSSLPASSSASVMNKTLVAMTGTITYDFIPHKNNKIGLDYFAAEARPVRGAVVEVIDVDENIIAAGVTNVDGSYLLYVPIDTLTQVRVKAELLRSTSPSWNFKVTDNTNNNALYALLGSLTSTGFVNSQRNLHAGSGWGGSSYSSERAAAPFAILDDIYIGVNGLNAAGNTRDFPPLELRWSVKNNEADDILTLGEIGTSFYDGDGAIYILGDANNDTDEFDRHVILHEWGHYIEEHFSRSDSMGGAHSDREKLDVRVAMSEGFANAFSAIMLADPFYRDSMGSAQNDGFFFNVSNKIRPENGFFNEGSIGSTFYNYYTSSNNKSPNDFTPIFSVLTSESYYNHAALTSIYLFYGQLKAILNDQATEFNNLMLEQNIYGTDEYALNETNAGGIAVSLPVYKTISPDGGTINVCSSSEFGTFNKLANSQFLKLTLSQAGSYTIYARKLGSSNVTSKPEIMVHSKGNTILTVKNTIGNQAIGNINLDSGIYIIEVYDLSNYDAANNATNTFCFDVSVMAN